MNLTLYSTKAFIVLDTEGQRVLAKYYRPKNHLNGEPSGLLTLKEQRAFEKGLWQKTKKPGGFVFFCLFSYFVHRVLTYHAQGTLSCTIRIWLSTNTRWISFFISLPARRKTS